VPHWNVLSADLPREGQYVRIRNLRTRLTVRHSRPGRGQLEWRARVIRVDRDYAELKVSELLRRSAPLAEPSDHFRPASNA
jgi:hypothetical protein